MAYDRDTLDKKNNFRTLPTLLEQRTIPEPNTGCLLWTKGADTDGYGKLLFNGKHSRIHRVVYESVHGPIPKGYLIQHTCDTPACCNIDHLRLGTPLSNMQDKVRKGRLRNQNMNKTHCKNGHAFIGWNLMWLPNGRRACRACIYASNKRFRLKRNLIAFRFPK